MNIDNIYEQEVGSPVNLKFRIQHSDIPKDTDHDTSISSLIKQVIFAETYLAKSNGRELSFKPAILKPKKRYTDVAIEGTLGEFLK